MGGRARVRAGVVWVCLALGAGGIVLLWSAGAEVPGASAELTTHAGPAARTGSDGEPMAIAARDHADRESVPDRHAVIAAPQPPCGEPGRQPQAAAEQIERWIEDLRDDDVWGNATAALQGLKAAGEAAVPGLERALWSADAQQRVYAAHALAKLGRPVNDPILAELADGIARHDIDRKNALATLIAVGPRAIPYLRPLLGSPHYATRFHAAYALARVGDPLHARSIAWQMIQHLGDNDTTSDASFAAQALYHIGAPAVSLLEQSHVSLDAQGRALVELILLDMREPPRTSADFARRQLKQQRHKISSLYADPVVEFDFERSGLPSPSAPR
jgi:hypothetical protein